MGAYGPRCAYVHTLIAIPLRETPPQAHHALMRHLAAALLLPLLVTACSNSKPSAEPVAPSPAVPSRATPSPTITPTAEHWSGLTAEQRATVFPAGYPQLVKVATLPDQVRGHYEDKGAARAVAIAPGVWAPLPPGAEPYDAIMASRFDGWCASIKTYGRKYLHGDPTATCW